MAMLDASSLVYGPGIHAGRIPLHRGLLRRQAGQHAVVRRISAGRMDGQGNAGLDAARPRVPRHVGAQLLSDTWLKAGSGADAAFVVRNATGGCRGRAYRRTDLAAEMGRPDGIPFFLRAARHGQKRKIHLGRGHPLPRLGGGGGAGAALAAGREPLEHPEPRGREGQGVAVHDTAGHQGAGYPPEAA